MNIAILVDIIKETKSNWRFIFESPLYDEINFIPGQLVQLVGNPYGPSEGTDSIKRNYSVASWPDGTNKFELIITYLEGGKMSEYLFKEAKIGDEVGYKGPMGVFTLPDNLMDRDIYFVSTGSGISPFRSMINYLHQNKIPFKNIKLFFGTRTEDDLVYRDELEKIQQELPNFEFIPTLSREDKPGFAKGYVHEHYLKLIDESSEKPWVYFCGWDRMISEGRFHLDERGFEMTKDIRVEIFG
jgi:CDP-4-dehydro-6-deoxyglucose reductase|tara:strand:+ start:12885 stop:13610 length:726 start_codon:yes stop_codon:yes gene_type:complete